MWVQYAVFSVVDVAQLVESRIVIPVVVGSSPIIHPSNIKHLAQLARLGFLLSGVHIAAMWPFLINA